MPDSAGRNGGGGERRDDEEEIEISLVQLDYFLDANPLGQGRKRKRERRGRMLEERPKDLCRRVPPFRTNEDFKRRFKPNNYTRAKGRRRIRRGPFRAHCVKPTRKSRASLRL